MLKPPRGTQLNRTHPLARSLGACWLFNEGAGVKVPDLSGNGWTGTLQGAPSWAASRFGSALYYDGDGDSVETSSPVITSAAVSVSLWFEANELPSARAEDGTLLIQRTVGSPYQSFRTLINDADDKILLLIYNASGVQTVSISSDSAVQTGNWYHVALILDSDYDAYMYVNGVKQANTGNSGSLYNANDVLRLGSRTGTADDFKGKIDLVTIFSRSLSAPEVTLLYRDPFCLFEPRKSTGRILSAPTVISLSGSTCAQSAAAGTLGSFLSSPTTERDWLRGALFNGVTPNAFKLGTTLSLGWFWLRTAGCSALYRGRRMDQIDFADILAVASHDAGFVSPADYTPHEFSSTHFYAVRRFNSCGYQERTLGAAARVRIGADGRLLEPQPNKAFTVSAEQTEGNRVQLAWFYCPLDQKSQPACFNVYYDHRTGQIDYQTPLASISYQGPRFYRYRSDTLETGGHLFAVSVEDANGVESHSSAQLVVQVDAASADSIEILSAGSL
jgi:hypothetical protein